MKLLDMEPVALISICNGKNEVIEHRLPEGDSRLHSADQLATLQHKANQAILDAANTALAERNALQAENERLWKIVNTYTMGMFPPPNNLATVTAERSEPNVICYMANELKDIV